MNLDAVVAGFQAAVRSDTARYPNGAALGPHNLVLGITDSSASNDALALCSHLCTKRPVTVHAVHVCRPLVSSSADPYTCGVYLESRKSDIDAVRARLFENADDRIPELTFRWCAGWVPLQLAKVARTVDALVVVVGSGTHGQWRWDVTRALLGPLNAGVLVAPTGCPWANRA